MEVMEGRNRKLYDNLLKSGKITAKDLGDFETFNSLITQPDKAEKLYNNLRKDDLFSVKEIGDQETFFNLIEKPQQAETYQSTQPTAQDTTQPFIDVNAQMYKDFGQSKVSPPQDDLGIGQKLDFVNQRIQQREAEQSFIGKIFDTKDEEIESLASNLYERSQRHMNAVKGEGGTGVGDVLSDRNFWTLGASDLSTMFHLRRIANKMDRDEPLKENEKLLLDAWATNEEVNQMYPLQDAKRGYQVGRQVTEMVPWLVQFAATRGAGDAAVKGIEGALRKGAQKYLGKTLGKIASKAAAEVGGAYGASALMPQTYGDIIGRSLGDTQRGPDGNVSFNKATADKPLEAIYKGWTNNMLEVLTERLGDILVDSKIIPKVNLADKIKGETGQKVAKLFNDFTRAVGWNGVGVEFLEEWINVPLNALLVGDSKFSDMFDLDQQFTTFLTVVAMGSAMGVGQSTLMKGASAIDQQLTQRDYRSAKNLYESEINEQLRKDIDKIVDSPDIDIEQQSKQLHSLLSKLDDEKSGIILNYVVNKMKAEGAEMTAPAEQQAPQPDPMQQVDALRNQAHQEAYDQVNSMLHNTGKYVTVTDLEGNILHVKSGDLNDPDGVLIVYEQDDPIHVKNVSNWETREPQEVIDEFIQKFDTEIENKVLQPQVGETVQVNGENFVVAEDLGNSFALMDENGSFIEVPKDQLSEMNRQPETTEYFNDVNNIPVLAQKIANNEQLTDEDLQLQNNFPNELETELQKLATQPQPKQTVVNTIPIGKTDYKYTVDEAGTFDIQIPEGLDPVKAEKEIRATLPKDQQNRIQVIQEEVETPPAVPWGIPTKENVVKMIRILPLSEQKDTTTPSQDSKLSGQSEQKPETPEQKTDEKLTETGTNVEKNVEKFTETETPQSENQPIDISKTSESLQKSETDIETGEQKRREDIERRRQEELNNLISEEEAKKRLIELRIRYNPDIQPGDIRQTRVTNINAMANNPEGWVLPEDEVEAKRIAKILDAYEWARNPRDLGYGPMQGKSPEKRINEKYDAELAKLQKQKPPVKDNLTTEKTGEIDREKEPWWNKYDITNEITDFSGQKQKGEWIKIANAYFPLEKAKQYNSKDELLSASLKEGRSQQEVQQAESEVNTNPTEAQKKAGNYKKGHVNVNGFDITIETPQGAIRKGDGWQVTMNNSYGYYNRTNGTEGKGEQVDVFLGPDLNSDKFFIVDQVNKDGSFDEHKVMQGFNTEAEAREAYLSNYEKGWKGLGAITELNKEEFSKWLKQNNPNTKAKRKPVSEIAAVKQTQESQLTNPVTEGEDTRDGSKYYLVTLNQEINDRSGLNKLAKQYKGGYSKFAKGYLFRRGDNAQENAEQFRQAVEQKYSNDEYKEPRSTEVIESEVKTIENEVETVKDRERAAELLEEIDDLLSDVEANLTLKQEGYSTEGIDHELPNIEVAKRIKKDVTKFSKTLAKGLGWEHDTDRRGKKEYAHANIAPAGGDATFILWKPNSEYGVYVSIPYNPDYSNGGGFDNYSIQGVLNNAGYGSILWRITSKDKKYTGFGNQYVEGDISVGEFAELIKKGIKPFEAMEQGEVRQSGKSSRITDQGGKEKESTGKTEKKEVPESVSQGKQPTQDEANRRLEEISDRLKSSNSQSERTGTADQRDAESRKEKPSITPLDKNLKEAEDRVNKQSEKSTIREIADQSDNIIIAKPGITQEDFKKAEQEKKSDYGKNNKIFTEDAANKARELLRKKLGGQLSVGIDPEIFTATVQLAGYHIEAGVRKFADFARVMVEDIGNGIKPYLKGVYENIRLWPGMQEVAKEMDSQDTVNNFDLDKNITNLAENQRGSETKDNEDRIIDKQNKDQNGDEQKATDDNQADMDEGTSAERTEGVLGERDAETDDNKQRGESQETGRNTKTEERETPAGRDRGDNSQRGSSGRGGLQNVEQKQSDTGETVSGDTERSSKLIPEQQNHIIEADDIIVPGGEISKIRTNIKSIKLAKSLEKNNKNATPEEKKILAQYVGWGGLAQVFKNEYWNESWKNKYGKFYNQLNDLLTPEELSAAKESTINAHYTDRSVIDAMWKMVEKMGFKGGRVIEPAGGIGHFFGLMPKNLQDNSQLRGVELDKISGLIFSKLYPQAKIDIKGFEQVNDPNNHYDLAITNVPFAGIHVYDSLNKDISKDFTLHNYFIAKSVRLLKPGGVGVFITTSSTMDNEGQGYKFRQWLHSNEGGNADLVDAIRLPNNAFKENAGTEVTTDILFIRKRDGETKHPLAKSFVVTGEYGEAMTKEVVGGYRNGRFQPSKESQKVTIRVNEFYLNNPDRMLGQMKLAHEVGAGGLYNPDQPTLHAPSSLNVIDELNKIADNFHENVFKEQEEVKDEIVYFAKDEQREGQLVTKDGKSYIVEFGILADTGWNTNNVTGEDKKKYTKAQVVDKYNEVKEAVIDLVNAESNPDSNDEQVEQLRKELNKVYDNYVKTIGNINGNRKTYFLRADVDYSLVSSLEELDKVAKKDKNGNWHYEDVVKKADIFSKRTNKPRKQPDRADNLEDAIDISNAYRNGLDINYISQLLNRDKETIQKELLDNELAYENPLTGIIEDRDTYLSGWVRKKLKHAEEAAQKDDKYNKNVEALRKVIPKDIPLIQIHAQIGASWIPNDIVSGWIDNLLEVKGTRAYHNKVTDQWSVRYPWEADHSIKNTNEHAAGEFEAKKLILDALNQRQPIAYDIFYDGDKKRQVKNEANTIAAQNKIGEFKVLFQDAIWDLKGENAERVARAYNDVYNAWVNKNITIPKNLKTFPGAVSEIDGKPIELRTHQKIAVKKALQGATMFAHQVGTGKTFSLITTAMEMKRLGIAKKPVIVVQRATTSQFVSWFRKLYPGAKLLVPDSKDLEASERKRLFAKIGLNEWDAVILYHDFLTRIPDKPERQIAYIRERIAELEAVSADEEVPAFGKTDNQKEIEKLENEILEIQERDRKTQESIEDKSTVKNKAKRAVSQRSKLQRQFDRATDQVLYFEDMGIDALLVDEAHTFKRLGLATKGGNVKGIDTSGSQKSLSAKLKTRFILENNNNKNVVFATGTPISNTMAEAYTMMNYLIPDRLSEHGVNTFDDFRTTFGHIRPSLEFTAAGNFKSVDRFAEYINLPELQRLWQSVADVVLTEEIDELKAGVGTPVLKDNSYTQVHIKQTDALANMMEGFKQELKEWENLPGKEKRALRHVPLVIFNQAKRAAVDVRLVDSRASDDPGSKVNIAVERAYDLYKESNKYKGTQLIFSDVIESSDGRFNLYQEVKKKLIAKGVPEKEIQIISDHDTDAKREKLFDNVNNGKVRFLIGSTDKMGIGVNVQERLKAVHHLDAPARPMDFEQRNGRLLRQGNLHLEMDLPVEVFLYGVEKTLDATAYQRLAIKQKFIRQMMKKGISSDRTLEDEDVDALGQTFDQMMANLSGSQYAIIHIKKSYDLRMAEMDKRNYERKQIDANDQINQNIYQNNRLQNAIEIAKKRIEYLKKNLPEREVTSLKISGGKEVKEDINKYLDDYSDEISGEANKLVFINGKIKGKIIFLKQYAKDPVTMRMSIEAGAGELFDLTSWNRYKTARGLFQKMFERIDELPGDIVRYKEHIAKNLSDNEKLQEIINQKYPKQNKLDELAKEVAELEVKMQEETSDKVKEIDKKIKDDDLTSIKEVADIPNLKLDHDLAELFYKNSDNFDKIEDEHYDSLKELGFIDQYGDLTEKGERFVDLVDKRKETRRRAKLGIDLFPGSTNIPEITGEDVDYTGVMFKTEEEYDPVEKSEPEVEYIINRLQEIAKGKTKVQILNHKDAAEYIKDKAPLSYEDIKAGGWSGFFHGGEIIINSNLPVLGAIRVWIHEKTHEAIRGRFNNLKDRIAYLNDVYSKITPEELQRVLKNNYEGYNEYALAEEYIAYLAEEYAISGKLSGNVSNEIKQIVKESVESFVEPKNINDEIINAFNRTIRGYQQIEPSKREEGIIAKSNQGKRKKDIRDRQDDEGGNRSGDVAFRRPQKEDYSLLADYLKALEKYYKDNPNEAPEIKRKITKAQNAILDDNGLIDKYLAAYQAAAEATKVTPPDPQTAKETYDRMREFWVDMNMPIRRWQEEIIKRGGKLPEDVNPYRDVRNMFGRMEALYRKFQKENIDPIKETITKLIKAGVSSNGILAYMIAKHGIERNRDMREQKIAEWKVEFEKKHNREASFEEILEYTDKISTEDFSGIRPLDPEGKNKDKSVDELAEMIVVGFEKQVDPKLVKEFWKNIKKATDFTLDTWLKGGQISQKQYEYYKNQYENFIPLRGWREDAAKFLLYKNTEGGTGRSLRHALGRKSLADNPLVYIQSVNFKAINEQVQNEIKQETFKVVFNNYGDKFKDLHKIKRAYLVKSEVLNEETQETEEAWILYRDENGNLARPPQEMFNEGLVKTEVNHEHEKLRTIWNARQHEVIVRNDGGFSVMVFEGKNLTIAQALNNQNTMVKLWGDIEFDARKLGDTYLFRGLATVTNFMKAMMTSYNPAFTVTNFLRDQPEAAITQFIRQNSRIADFPTRLTPIAAKAIVEDMSGKFDPNNKYHQELKNFYEAGGTTGFTHEKSPESLEKELNNDLKRLMRSDTLRGKTLDRVVNIFKYIEHWNRLFEDTTRFAVYLSAREKGLSVKDSAFESRNASVDFNMKGKGTRMVEALFAFFKAGTNALQKNFQLAKNKPKKFAAVSATVITLGFLEAMLNDWSDDDDDEKYYRLNDYVRENYFVMKKFWGDEGQYLRVPLPQFWRGFHAMGVSLYDFIVKDKITAGEVVAKTMSNMLAGMAPIDVTGFIHEGKLSSDPLWPTAISPVREIVVNSDFMGNKIAYEAFTKALEEDLADSGLHKKNVNPAAKLLTDMIFKAGGGEGKLKFKIDEKGKLKYVPNLMDINPSKVEHLITGYLGGTGKFVNDFVTTVWQLTGNGDGVELNNVPFLNTFIRNIPEEKWNVIRQYQKYQEYIDDADKYRSTARGEKNIEGLKKYFGSDYAKAKILFNAYDKRIDSIMERKGFDSEDASKMITDLMREANTQLEKLNIKR